MLELRTVALLLDVFSTLSDQLPASQVYALEGLRNLCFVELSSNSFPTRFLPQMWSVLLDSSEVRALP